MGSPAVRCGINPAVDGIILLYQVKFTGTGDGIINGDLILHDSGGGSHQLEGGTWSCYLLGRTIIKGTGFVRAEFLIIFTVHRVCQQVIVIAGIGYTGQHVAIVRIRNDYRTGAGFQSQLGRCQLQLVDLGANEIISAHRT